eukprot:TRINITY_DN23313_c0_g1_i1.p1 TRINITY_DN23313_c0_g1~~TRINITY_DN23313_c0_g1_i1.p1  ORF type:complete len:534 (-),score=119.75 TRINITY_DN23313_c0_g1_i1:105-1706(-)
MAMKASEFVVDADDPVSDRLHLVPPSPASSIRSGPGIFLATTPWRWGALGGFALLTMMNAAVWLTFSAFPANTRTAFDTTNTFVTAQSWVFMGLYIPFNFVASSVLSSAGPRFGVLVGGLLTALGAWIRCLAAIRPTSLSALILITVGQTVAAAGQPFLLNAPTTLAGLWFSDTERVLAASLMVAANSVGAAIGSALPPIIVGLYPGETREGVLCALYVEAGMATMALLAAAALIRTRPKVPPSIAAARVMAISDARSAAKAAQKAGGSAGAAGSDVVARGSGDVAGDGDVADVSGGEAAAVAAASFWRQSWDFIRSRDGLLLTYCIFCNLGIINTLATVLKLMVAPYGFGDSASSVLAVLFIVLGITGSVALGTLVDVTKRAKDVLVGLNTAATVGLLGFYFMLRYHSFQPGYIPPLGALTALLGFSMIPAMPISFDLAAEVSFPIPESISQGTLVLASQVSGMIMLALFGTKFVFDTDTFPSTQLLIVCVAICASTIPATLFISGHRRRDVVVDVPLDDDDDAVNVPSAVA